jgi:hypothetical protein
MVAEKAASVQGVAIRATRLAADGSPATGATASYAMEAFISATWAPDYDEGEEIAEKGANGLLCVYYKANDTLKRVTLSLAICEPDPEFTEIVSGGTLLAATTGSASTLAADSDIGDSSVQVTANIGVGAFTIGSETVVVTGVTGAATPFTAYLQFPLTATHTTTAAITPIAETVGYAAPAAGTDPTPDGVALEVWSYAVANSRRAGNRPYFRWVFPSCQLRPSGDRAIENGLMANTFSGYGVGNAFFGDGPQHDWPFLADRPYQYARDAAAPIGVRGYQTVT